MKIVTCTGCIISRKNVKGETEVLLIRRSASDKYAHQWEYPKGRCKTGESAEKCLNRELFEETGLKVDIVRYLGKIIYKSDKDDRKAIINTFHAIISPDSSEDVKLSFEHSEFCWVSQMSVIQLMVSPEQARMISKVMNGDNKIVELQADNNELVTEGLFDD